MNEKMTDKIIRDAAAACRSFAAYQPRFFNFESRAGWRGWENWLTVDICRRLNHKHVLPFFRYPQRKDRMHLDLLVSGDRQVAVEIKVNFIDDDEISTKILLPERILDDRDKLETLDRTVSKLLLISTCFESGESRQLYQSKVQAHIKESFAGWKSSWHDCSIKGEGWNTLLALSKISRTASN